MTASVNTFRQLNDLPATFTRPGAPYTQWVDSGNMAAQAFTEGFGALLGQNFGAAQYGWLDVWGAVFTIARNAYESDGAYRLRITRSILAWVGTVPSIEQWGQETLGVPVTVTENSGLGYAVTIPGNILLATVNAFLTSLNRIRPAGVPFTAFQQQIGLYLDTINFMDTPDVIGSYITDGVLPVTLPFGPLTNNTQSVLPEYYFVDPVLNGTPLS